MTYLKRVEHLLFLAFAVPPALVLALMNLVWTDATANIGCVVQRDGHQIELLFAESASARGKCLQEIHARDAEAVRRHAAEARRAHAVALAASAKSQPRPTMRTAVAVAEGRFQWMAFHLAALVLFSVVALVSAYVIWRNLSGRILAGTALVTVVLSLVWASDAVANPNDLDRQTASLLLPTIVDVLPRFDSAFAEYARRWILIDYGAGLAVTVLIVVAAASVMNGVVAGSLTAQDVARKRRHLKLVIATAGILMTFLALWLGEWLAWPAQFAPAAETSGSMRGSSEEIRGYASGLRLYFGTGYSLALIAFAVPATIAFSARRAASMEAGAGGGEPQQGGSPASPPYLDQWVFTKEEIGIYLSVLMPFASTLISAAVQL